MAAIWADDIFKRIFLNEKVRIFIKISLKFVPKSLIDNNQALVLITAWRRIGDKPLSEPVLTRFTDAYMFVFMRDLDLQLILYQGRQWMLRYTIAPMATRENRSVTRETREAVGI